MLNMYPHKATVCSVGIVKVRDNRMMDEFHSLVNPPEELQFGRNETILNLHGIMKDVTEGSPSFVQSATSLPNTRNKSQPSDCKVS